MAPSDSEAESLVSVSSQSQHFEPQEDDYETLWEVIEITGEKDKSYKVRWKGTDPSTRKPWAQSWVPKKDCTDDLVFEWKRKKKEKERRKSTTSKRGRESTASKKTARMSTATVTTPKASTSKLSNSRRSTSTIHAVAPVTNRDSADTEATTSRRGRSTATITPNANRTLTGKPKPKTKRVIDTTIEEDELVSEDNDFVPTVPSTKVDIAAKGKKRKLAEADSAHNSANTGSGSRAGPLDVNVKDPTPKPPQGRPKKKRKVEVEVVKPEPEEDEEEQGEDLTRSLSTRTALLQEEEHGEEEEEERMVEDALSEGINSPPPVEHFQEEGGYYDDDYDNGYDNLPVEMQADDDVNSSVIKKNKGKGRALDVSKAKGESEEVDELEDDEDVVSLASRTTAGRTVKTKPGQKKATASKLNGKSKSTNTGKGTTTAASAPTTTTIVAFNTTISSTGATTTATKAKAKSKPKPPTSIIAPPESRSNSPSPPPQPKFGPPKRRSVAHSQSISKEPSVLTAGTTTAKVPTAGPSATTANANTNGKPDSRSKPKSTSVLKDDNHRTTVAPTIKKPRPGSYRNGGQSSAASDSDEDKPGSDSDDEEPPPLDWPGAASTSAPTAAADNRHRAPTEERSVFWDGGAPTTVVGQDEDDNEVEGDGELQYPSDPEPVLSPAATKRLEEFDEEFDKALSAEAEDDEREQGQDDTEKTTAAAASLVQHRQASKSKSKSRSTGSETETEEQEKEIRDSTKKRLMFRPKGSSALIIGSGLEYTSDAATEEAEEPAEEVEVRSTPPDSKSSKPKSKSPPSTTTTAVAPAQPAKQQQQRTTKPPQSSYNTDVVPETEPEPESQSQSQSQSQDIDLPTAATAVLPSYASQPQTPGGKGSLRSRMKPRTPLSRTSSAIEGRERSLRPIPMLSPSTFHPHLSSIAEPQSSLPESIEVESDVRPHRSHVDDDADDEEDAPMSSIEQFESPEKGKQTKKITIPVEEKKKPTQKESITETTELDVVKRGQELAEAAKRRREMSERRSGSSPPKARRTIADIRATRSRSAIPASHASERSGGGRSLTHSALGRVDEQADGDEEMQDVSTAVAPPTSGPRAVSEDSVALQELEQAYVDLSGGTGDNKNVNDSDDDDGNDTDVNASPVVRDPVLMRQEEEESTQDVLMEFQAVQQQQRVIEDIDIQSGWTLGPAEGQSLAQAQAQVPVQVPALQAPADQDSNKGKGKERSSSGDDHDYAMDDMDIPKIVVEGASRAASARPYSPEEGSREDLPIRSRLRSRSNTPSVATSHRSNVKGKKAEQDVLSKSPSKSRGGSVKPSRQTSLAPNDDSTQLRLNTALELVNSKSEEIARLNAELASERAKNEGLQQEVHALQPQLVHLTQLEAVKNEEAMKRLADLEAQHIQHLAEKSEWQMDRALLVAQVEASARSKADAEKDREFFRDQYSQASGYVTRVRDENRELEQRIEIAEGQAQGGVALVRSTFEQRVKALEDDLKAWRKMAEFLIEKDRLSNGDELRRRAAEEPELRARCDRQEDALELQQERLDLLEEEVTVWRASEKELEQWKKETARLTVALNEATSKLDRIGRAGDPGESMDTNSNGHEFVYCCQWRTHNGHESSSCREVFSTISELEQHLYSGGHLQHT